jgi:hypothetical protein
MPFVEKKLDGFLTAENAESAERKDSPRRDTEKILARTTKNTKHTKKNR